jgi:superfamily II DNA or RNA helicase
MVCSKDSTGLKCAVGYFYIEGLAHIIEALRDLKEIKILMGIQTTKLTKEELIKTFTDSLNSIESNNDNIRALALFHSLVREAKTLQVKVYLGGEQIPETLHSKAYIFLNEINSRSYFKRYTAGIIGSSNLTPSGLISNTELNVIISEGRDLKYVEEWFDELWENGSDDFNKLRITEAITNAIEKSKFGQKIQDKYVYVKPERFFKILIKFMKADYLFEDWKKSSLLGFQQVDAIRCLTMFSEKNYRGIFLTSSVGLGKSYVACQLAKYFLRDNKKVLLIAPSGLIHNKEQWHRYLKEFKLIEKVDILPMGELQKDPFKFEKTEIEAYEKNYSLIVIDEVHNYRNKNAFRTRNLKRIIDKNGDSKILLLTATPINTSPEDLVNLIDLFYRPGSNLHFDKIYHDLLEIVSLLKTTQYLKLTNLDKNKISSSQEFVEKELFVKSTHATIKSSPHYLEQIKLFSGVDISKIPDPVVEEIIYLLDDKYKKIINGIVDFLSSLSAANLRIIDPEKGARLSIFFKWILYKRFESDVTSYYITLKKIHKKNRLIIDAIERRDDNLLPYDKDYEDDIEVKLGLEFREKISDVIEKIKTGKGEENLKVLDDLKSDTQLIQNQLKELESLLISKNSFLFVNDKKLSELLKCIKKNSSKKILVFTEYKDTLNAIREFFFNKFNKETIEYVESKTANKTNIIERFNKNDQLQILVTTDTLSEGYNISGADIVINFDIPYNPVRLIQRIGRATRLDNPKAIGVFNFRPVEDIDKELDLVDRLQVRIEDIINFVGVEYRIWFQREEILLKHRREKDVKIYKEILKGIRHDLWNGKLDELQVDIPYTRPLIVLLQKAILKYGITKEDVVNTHVSNNTYTLLGGTRNLSLFYDGAKSFNENTISSDIYEFDEKIDFEETFAPEIAKFLTHIEKEKKKEIIFSYYNNSTDKMIRSIRERITVEGYTEIYPEANDLLNLISSVRDNCGFYTEKIVRRLYKDIRNHIKPEKFRIYNKELRDSFTHRKLQTKLPVPDNPYLALGFLER